MIRLRGVELDLRVPFSQQRRFNIQAAESLCSHSRPKHFHGIRNMAGYELRSNLCRLQMGDQENSGYGIDERGRSAADRITRVGPRTPSNDAPELSRRQVDTA